MGLKNPTFFAGMYRAAAFAYGVGGSGVAGLQVDMPGGVDANTTTQTLTLAFGNITLDDGTVLAPLATNAKVTVGTGSGADSVTLSAVSTNTPDIYQSTTFTAATFSYAHGTGDLVASATIGLQEAINSAAAAGGGIVVVDAMWYKLGGTSTIFNAASVPAKVTLWDVSNGDTSNFDIIDSTATPPLSHGITGTVTANYAGSVTPASNLVGVRGEAHIASGTTLAANYVYGTEGKLFVPGVLAGTAWAAGLVGQLDLSTATLTSASHVTPIWSDAGATAPSGSCTFADSLVLTNTTAATFNSLIYGYSKAAFAFDLTDNGGGFIVGTTASTPSGCLKVKINGATKYIQLYTTEG